MLRNVIAAPRVTEIYKVSAAMKRGSVVTKNLSITKADPADGEGVQIYFLDKDNQPTGHLSDVEISQYDDSMDIVKADTLGILVKYSVGAQIATDQVAGTFAAGDYAIAGSTTNVGKLIKAVSTKVSTLKYIGDYVDAGHTLKLFEVVHPHTVPS